MSSGPCTSAVPTTRLPTKSCDPVAKLCAFLIARRGWSCHRLAETLGVPPLIIEECVRNGASSGALHSRVARWIVDGCNTALPRGLVEAVARAPAVNSSGNDNAERLLDGDVLTDLDPVTRAYFIELGSSIGQGFISILNDPRQTRESFRWGSWLAGLVPSTSNHKAYVKRTVAVLTDQPSSEVLMGRYNQCWDYEPYLQLVSGPLSENCKERGPLVSGFSGDSQFAFTPSRSSDESLPWPEGVPQMFFDESYDAVSELHLLERMLGERRSGGAENNGVLITATTFSDDFEEIEKRMKELRMWEGAVEGCLLQHVQSRADKFFIVSQNFADRAGEASKALEDLQKTRADVDAYGTGFVKEMMTIARNYRVRHGLGAARDLAQEMLETVSRVTVNENWISLPERDMTELPFVVDNYCALHRSLFGEDSPVADRSKSNFCDSGNLNRVKALEDLPERLLYSKESLHNIIMKEMEIISAPPPGSVVDEGRLFRAVRAAKKLNLLPAVLHQNRERLPDTMWSSVRATFVSGVIDSGAVGERGVDSLLEVAAIAGCSHEEKLSLISLSDPCRVPAFMQILGTVTSRLSDFVKHSSRCWVLLVTEGGLRPCSDDSSADDGEENLWAQSKRYLAALFAAAESVVTLFLEARSRPACVPTNVRDVEMLVTAGYDFMQDMVTIFDSVAVVVGDLGDPWNCLSGKQLKASVLRLGKEHVKSRHAANIERIRLTLEGEKWAPCDSDVSFQSRVSSMFSSDDEAVSALQALAVFSDFKDTRDGCHRSPKACSQTVVTESTEANAVAGEAEARKAFVLPSLDEQLEGRVVSISLQILLEVLCEYDGYLGRFPFLAFDIMGKVYDLLKLYNSQCAALLLGAMAVENGALESITVPHMAVASQNLALLHDGIPLMQRRWERVAGAGKLPSSTSDDMRRVQRDCKMYRLELLGKITGLVKEKVGVLGDVSGREWQDTGSPWVMTILRETARVMRMLNPLVPPSDCRGVVIPLLGTFARMLRTVMMSPDIDEVELGVMRSDVLVFKANVERFGFDVMRCVELYVCPEDAMKETNEPCSTDEAVVAWFFGQA